MGAETAAETATISVNQMTCNAHTHTHTLAHAQCCAGRGCGTHKSEWHTPLYHYSLPLSLSASHANSLNCLNKMLRTIEQLCSERRLCLPSHYTPPTLHLLKVCKTLCQKINSRQNILIYSTIFDRRRRRRRRHFLGLLPRIIYACFNFICCLTNATPIRQSKICYFDTFKVAPLCKHAHNFLRL